MPSVGSSESDPGRSQRAEKLLACFQSALNHDLPNQLIGLQGLLQFLEIDEKGQLGKESGELLRRLDASARRALDTIFMMRDLQRLTSKQVANERVRLAEVAPEVLHDIGPLFPEISVESRLKLEQAEVVVGRQPLQRALVQLGRLALSLARGNHGTVEIGCRARANGAEVWITLEETTPAPGMLKGAERRYEFLVARALAESWGGALSQQAGASGPLFMLTIPK
jgi:light-regulated signal transduction histidine kinase (bacteriophytochrome)